MSIIVGRIDLIIGPMFAGKTTELIRRVQRAELSNHRCILIKYSHDGRYSKEDISTQDSVTRVFIPCAKLIPFIPVLMKYDVIGIDEAQFFSDIFEFAQKMANCGKMVLVASLDGTFKREPFGKSLELISVCESITKLSAICRETGKDAAFTKRIVKVEDEKLIGGAESYSAVSRSSYFNLTTKGEIHMIIGPVKSGKTTELIRQLQRYKIAGRNVLIIRHVDSNIDHHDPNFTVQYENELPKNFSYLKKFDIIGVDEAQRFDGIAEWADHLANTGKLVVISALDGDSQQKAYHEIVSLVSKSEKISKLDSVCPLTGLPAPFSALVDGVRMIPISRLALISGAYLGFVPTF